MAKLEVTKNADGFFIRKGEKYSLSINNPDASIGVCCSHKVIALGFNTLCYDAERRGIKASARIGYVVIFTVTGSCQVILDN